MSDRTVMDAAFIARYIERLKERYPELGEDAELLSATIEGETDFEGILSRLVEAWLANGEQRTGATARLEALEARIKRYAARDAALRDAVLDLMHAADQPLIRLPEVTLSLVSGRESVIIDNADDLPQGMFRMERVPSKAEIGKALKAGEAIPGAHLERSPMTVSIRTK